jgi:pimeloyl-ACP methyl ester carboxylesterase
MRRDEIEAAGALVGDALGAGAAVVRDMHAGIAARPFGILGPLAAPVRVVHDGIAGVVHGAVGHGLRVAPRAGAAVMAARARADAAPVVDTARGGLAVSAVCGLHGDRLAARGSALASGMRIRRAGADVPATAEALAAVFPDATPRAAVFVHGLGETELAWRLRARGSADADRRSYGERLQAELGVTPVEVRFNSGLRISENGRALARLLDAMAAAWPTDLQEIALVGHSMGGLVARSACHYGALDGLRWTAAVRHVICLGTPHLGADLEKGVNVLGWALGRLPESRALARVLAARSVGIKDLRYGACVEDDWRDADPDELLRDRCREVPFLPHARYCFVAARLRRGPLGALAGDLLVRMPSASGRGAGRGRRVSFAVEDGRELDGLTHFDLLNHPAVYAELRAWLVTATPGETDVSA